MKMTDLRAKARAIFGSAVAEPMPNQPNGAKALQQRANARPIPTYKVGGVVKKNDGGLLKKPVRGRSVTIPLEEEKLQTRRDFAKPLPKKQPKIVDVDLRQPKTGRAPANAPKPPEMMRGPTKPGRGEAMMEARRAAGMSREADDVMMTTRRGKEIMDAQKRMEAVKDMERRKKQEAADKLLGMRMKNGGKAGCYADGGDVKAERIAARMAAGNYKKGGKVQTSADTAKKLATEMGGMKKGGKPKDGLAVMIAIGKVKKPAKKMGGGMMYADGGKPEKMAVGGAGKTRKGQAPIKKAQGGVATYQGGGKATQKKITPEEGEATRQRLLKLYGATGAAKKAAQEAKDARDGGFNSVAEYRRWLETAAYNTGVARGEIKDKAHGGVMKKAQGGAAKVRKGMMSPTGDIKKVVTPKKGIGGM